MRELPLPIDITAVADADDDNDQDGAFLSAHLRDAVRARFVFERVNLRPYDRLDVAW